MNGMKFSDLFALQNEIWNQSNSLRRLKRPSGLDFCSNDYLGFASSSALKQQILEDIQQFDLGSTGSRLLRGHSQSVEELESQLAAFSGSEASLFFSSGYQANLALFSSLLRNAATVFSDESVHASIIDGIRLSGCEKFIWPHNDLNHLEMLLKQKVRTDRINFVSVESIYSMTGDFAPLRELADLCEKYGAHLIVDEAHATGLFGAKGAGRVDQLGLNHRVFAKVHTAGKALGVSGAWVAGTEELKSLLINTARPFIYTTAPAFYQQRACGLAIEKLQDEFSGLVQNFQDKVAGFQKFLMDKVETSSLSISGWQSPVTALICGTNEKAMAAMTFLAERGFDVRAIRPPSVPSGESLLRITIPLSRSTLEIEKLKEAIGDYLEVVE